MKKLTLTFLTLTICLGIALAQNSKKDQKIIEDTAEAKAEFLEADPDMASIFSSSYCYIILPNVGKGGLGVGAASGNGVAYEKGSMIGFASMKQLSIGFQAGGQA
ncbi:hypothetical protein [Algoriphagus sediminis]|uniref:Uncharacterized protein n=1 Tax=Algoriphagus sediminis TaxID=3057113 RepID=A0ABT7YHC1_9BACT|nr:hypothetical protein [Algoriphagus sediminis]MDN3205873.1 hypothetical protein [Algoriphagus sediminis]